MFRYEKNFIGLIGEVAIWNRALSVEEIGGLRGLIPPALPYGARIAQADRIALTGGSMLLGMIENGRYTITTSFGKIEIPAGRVAGFVREAKKDAPSQLVLADGQVLVGKLSEKAISLKLSTGSTLRVPIDSIIQCGCRITDEKPASLRMSGQTVKAPVAQIASIVRASALPPGELLKKIETLIARLGAAAFADRQEATKELIRIGLPVKSIIEKHLNDPDPEIRQRIRQILKKINPPKPESMRVEPYTGNRSDPGIIK